MNTQTHVVLSLVCLGRKNIEKSYIPIIIGALLPDAMMFVFYGIEKARGIPEEVIWNEHYFDPRWQLLFDPFNSFPIVAGVWLLCYLVRWGWGQLLCASMFLHCLLDFPLHNDDAHRHFWPLSDYQFHSPLSYWDPQYHGNVVAWIEMIGFLGMCSYLFRKWTTWVARGALLLTLISSVNPFYSIPICSRF